MAMPIPDLTLAVLDEAALPLETLAGQVWVMPHPRKRQECEGCRWEVLCHSYEVQHNAVACERILKSELI